MKTLLAILLTFICMSNSFSQTEAETKAWMEYMTPGSVHEMIAKGNGDWVGDITMWMSPDAAPMKATSIANNKMILGGRYQYSTHTGDMMGMPFEGISIVGYDNALKVFKSSWIDNMGTGIMNLQGPWDPSTNSVTLTGMTVDPSTGTEVSFKEIFKIIDDNNQILEMYSMKDGKEFKTMEIKLTRK